jgi:Flp pilus assembly protein TadB
MQIVVTELPIEEAVKRARQRFRQADERLSRAQMDRAPGPAWTALGVLATVAGLIVLMGVTRLSAATASAIGMPVLLLGGAFSGHGLPRWWRSRQVERRHQREWQHALDMLCLREEQALEDPALTVEVLERIHGQHPEWIAGWSSGPSTATKYLQ